MLRYKGTERNFHYEKLNDIAISYIGVFKFSVAAVQKHPFSNISPENTSFLVLILVKLQIDYSE